MCDRHLWLYAKLILLKKCRSEWTVTTRAYALNQNLHGCDVVVLMHLHTKYHQPSMSSYRNNELIRKLNVNVGRQRQRLKSNP